MTRFYFHVGSSGVSGTLPQAKQSSLTKAKGVDAETVNRAMDTSAGASQTSLVLSSLNNTSTNSYYFTKFVSPVIYQTSVAANTWTYHFAVTESNTSANFPVTTNNKVSPICCYVWRPSDGSLVGYILNGSSAATLDEASTSETARVLAFTGSLVSNVQYGDVIVFEVWFTTTQGSATAYNDTWWYDGTTTYADGAAASTCASYIETPETLQLTQPQAIEKVLTTETVAVEESIGRVKETLRPITAETLTISYEDVQQQKGQSGPRNIEQALPTEATNIAESSNRQAEKWRKISRPL